MGVVAAHAIVRPHDLLRVHHNDDSAADAPLWAIQALTQTPWVVVRRGQASPGRLPVGVRGTTRGQRWGTTIPISSVAERLTPEQLTDRINTLSPNTPAAVALSELHTRLRTLPLRWGPTGSAGFQLASGLPTLQASSDLDIVIRASSQISVLPLVHESLKNLPTHVDTQVDFGFGAVALAELLSGTSDVLMKTVAGPTLIPIAQLMDTWSHR